MAAGLTLCLRCHVGNTFQWRLGLIGAGEYTSPAVPPP